MTLHGQFSAMHLKEYLLIHLLLFLRFSMTCLLENLLLYLSMPHLLGHLHLHLLMLVVSCSAVFRVTALHLLENLIFHLLLLVMFTVSHVPGHLLLHLLMLLRISLLHLPNHLFHHLLLLLVP